MEATSPAREPTHAHAIRPHHEQEHRTGWRSCHPGGTTRPRPARAAHRGRTSARTRRRPKSATNVAKPTPALSGRATTTMSNPPRARAPIPRHASFRRRRQRLRATAPPIARPQTNPIRMSCSEGRTYSITHVPDRRRPDVTTARYCPAVRRTPVRAAAAFTPPDQADSWTRPLRRRRASTARPPRVRMRTRKPCVLFRLRLFG
jgi:hypothetical protein